MQKRPITFLQYTFTIFYASDDATNFIKYKQSQSIFSVDI